MNTINCYATTIPTTTKDTFSGLNQQSCILKVPSQALNDYKSTSPWSSFLSIEPLTTDDILQQSRVLDGKKIYNMQGTPVTNTKQEGIYIIEG